jgi:hypothetical protein
VQIFTRDRVDFVCTHKPGFLDQRKLRIRAGSNVESLGLNFKKQFHSM